MKILKLLEGLYHELKTYNERERQKDEKRNKRSHLFNSRGHHCVNLKQHECLWIRDQLFLKDLRITDIALKANRSPSLVSQVLCGELRSEEVEAILAKSLGYESFDILQAAAAKAEMEDTSGLPAIKPNNQPAHLRTTTKPLPPEYSWLRRQLASKNIKQKEIARKANCARRYVSMVVCGERSSREIEAALAEMLGYPSWQHLWADALINAERRAV
jgi:transcriptional regulator with XRE-family HTH domain